MRGLRRLVLLAFFIIIGIPFAVGGAALIKDETEPTYLQNFDYQSYDQNIVILEKIESMMLANALGVKKLYIDDETVNKIIYKNMNGFTNHTYVIEGREQVTVKSLWSSFKNNELIIYSIFKYRQIETSITVKLGFENDTENVKVKMNSMKIGQLPLPNNFLSYGLKSLEDFLHVDLNSQYQLGELNIEQLYVTVGQTLINDVIRTYLNSDLIVYQNIELVGGKLMIEYDFNPNNPKHQIVNDTISEIKRVIRDEDTKTNSESVLDLSNPVDEKFYQDINDLIDTMLIPRMDQPDTYGMNDFSNDEKILLNSLNSNFSALDNSKKYAVVDAIIKSFDPDIRKRFETEILPIISDNNNSFDLINKYLIN